MAPYRILLVDDHTLFRQGVRKILEEIPGLEVTKEVDDGIALLEILREITPDMVILDISMPNLRGIEAMRESKMKYPDLRILILTMHKNREYLYQAVTAGAAGYLLKEDADTDLRYAIDTIRQGKTYISPLLAEELKDDLVNIFQRSRSASPFGPLTTREREVLKLIAEGKSTKDIATLLHISVRTVQHHRSNIMEKLSAKSTVDLVKYAINNKYV